MNSSRDDEKQPANMSHIKSAKGVMTFDPGYIALPLEEIQELVWQITADGNIEKFMRVMVMLLDDFGAGQTNKLKEVAEQSNHLSYLRLMSAIKTAAGEAQLVAARNTVFYAANCAFQRSRVYAYVLMNCLDDLRQNGDSQDSK